MTTTLLILKVDSNGLLYVLGISSSSNNISTINTNTPSHSNADSFLINLTPVEIEFGVLILVENMTLRFL
jgi:hypothetical protein